MVCAPRCVLVCVLASTLACASTDETTLTVTEAVSIDGTLVDEVVPLTASLIRAAPVNPPGGEGRVARLLAERLSREPGIVVETRPFGDEAADRVNLLATLAGRDPTLRPILLVAHSDVVPAEDATWGAGARPFEGAVVGDALVGRGAADMLGMAALEALTLVALARRGEPLDRSVMLLVVGDEETLSLGMEAALRDWPVVERAAVALNEGGFIVEDLVAPGHDAAALSVAEKGFLHVELTARGDAGHGSMPREGDAPARLARAVSRIMDMPHPFRITKETAATFAALGHARGGAEHVVMGEPALIELLARERLDDDPQTSSIVHDTCALTVLDAGDKTNVIPSTARAVFDCRLLPGTDPVLFFDELLVAVGDPRVQLRVLASSRASGSPTDHPLLDVVRARLLREPRPTTLVPILSRGYTGSRLLRTRGVPSYGLIPVRMRSEDIARMHGADESVRTEALREGLSRLVDVVVALAARPLG